MRMVKHTGLPVACFVGRNVDPEVGFFFKKELFSRIMVFYSKGSIGGFLNSLPLLEDIESAISSGPQVKTSHLRL